MTPADAGLAHVIAASTVPLVRLSCFFIAFLAMMTIFVLADLWRIERRTGRQISAIAVAFLGAAVLVAGVLFARCAITGCYPEPPAVGGCP